MYGLTALRKTEKRASGKRRRFLIKWWHRTITTDGGGVKHYTLTPPKTHAGQQNDVHREGPAVALRVVRGRQLHVNEPALVGHREHLEELRKNRQIKGRVKPTRHNGKATKRTAEPSNQRESQADQEQ